MSSLGALTLTLLTACGPQKPVRLEVAGDGVHYAGTIYACQGPLMVRLDPLDRDRQIEIVPTGTADNLTALRVEASVEAKGFKFIAMTLATGKGAWSTYPPMPPSTELETCRTAASPPTRP